MSLVLPLGCVSNVKLPRAQRSCIIVGVFRFSVQTASDFLSSFLFCFRISVSPLRRNHLVPRRAFYQKNVGHVSARQGIVCFNTKQHHHLKSFPLFVSPTHKKVVSIGLCMSHKCNLRARYRSLAGARCRKASMTLILYNLSASDLRFSALTCSASVRLRELVVVCWWIDK